MNQLPSARTDNLVVQSLDKELLVYDLKTHLAYCLNETSSAVYEACDGKTTFAQLRAKTGFPDELIFLTLDELARVNLILNTGRYHSPFQDISRREAIRKVGLASMISLPLISSLVAPTAAAAQSGGAAPGSRNLGESCSTSAECASSAPNCTGGTCCAGTFGNNPSGYTGSSIINGTCPASAGACSVVANSCCSSAANVVSCIELAPGTIQVQCQCV